MINRYRTVVAKICKKLNKIGEVCIVLSMVLIILNIITRSFFNYSIAGLVDYVSFLMALIVGVSLAYTAVDEGHLEVDFILAYFPKIVQRVAYLLVNVTYFVFLAIFTVFIFMFAYNAFVNNEVSMTAKMSAYPFIIAVAIGMGMYCLVTLGKMLKVAIVAITGKEEVDI